MDTTNFETIAFVIAIVIIIAIFACALLTIINFFDAIINFKKPELFCAKCGKKVGKKTKKCPRCKEELINNA